MTRRGSGAERTRVGEDGSPDRDWQRLAAVALGDEAAFESLVRDHQRRLLALCRRLLQDRDEAEEAVQEVFLKLFRRAHTFEPRGKVSTLLYRIATNHCLNVLRRRRLVRFLPLGGDGGRDREGEVQEPSLPDQGGDALAHLESRETWRRVRRALERLPAAQRTALLLVRLEGLSYRQAAEVMGVSVGSVEARIFRAMRRLEKSVGFDRLGGSKEVEE